MNSISTEYGYLTLTDISGYNAFVAGTEFDHAQEIIRDLLEFLVHRLRPLLTLVQIEGDAVFAYTPENKLLRGETLFELIENTYSAFKNQLTSIKRHHTCTCAACQNVNTLDLKFFVHYGEYIEQSIDDYPQARVEGTSGGYYWLAWICALHRRLPIETEPKS